MIKANIHLLWVRPCPVQQWPACTSSSHSLQWTHTRIQTGLVWVTACSGWACKMDTLVGSHDQACWFAVSCQLRWAAEVRTLLRLYRKKAATTKTLLVMDKHFMSSNEKDMQAVDKQYWTSTKTEVLSKPGTEGSSKDYHKRLCWQGMHECFPHTEYHKYYYIVFVRNLYTG